LPINSQGVMGNPQAPVGSGFVHVNNEDLDTESRQVMSEVE
jgi:hypothetical protein